jgi:hypothetical protein
VDCLDIPNVALPDNVKDQFHDAAFDALQTGRVFLGLMNEKKSVDWKTVFAESVWMMPLNASDQAINLNGADQKTDFSNVLLASDLPAGWKQSDLNARFSQQVKRVAWIRDDACGLVFQVLFECLFVCLLFVNL